MPSKGKGKGISGAREAWRALRRGERNPAWNYCVLLPSLFFISIHQRNVKILFGQPITLVLVFQRAQLRAIKATGDVCAQAATWWISSPPGEALIGFSNLCRLIGSLQSFVSPLLLKYCFSIAVLFLQRKLTFLKVERSISYSRSSCSKAG